MYLRHVYKVAVYLYIYRSFCLTNLRDELNDNQVMEQSKDDCFKLKIETSRREHVYLKRKELCSLHSLRYRYKCMFVDCGEPFTCGKQECMEGHFHKGILSLMKFNSDSFRSKCQKAQKMINNSEKIHSEAMIIKFTIEGMINSLTRIFKDLSALNDHSEVLKAELDQSLTPKYVKSLDELIEIESKITDGMSNIKQKIICEVGLKDSNFLLKEELITFLKDQIVDFNWDHSKQVWSNKQSLTSCQKFHQKLQNKDRLLYLFIDQKKLIGSYYPDTYPTMIEKTKKSLQSFIFMAEANKSSFIKFVANPQSDYHMQISEKLLICQGNSSNGDGLRTFANNFDVMDYYFPSLSYLSTETSSIKQNEEGMTYFGQIKPKNILILQVNTFLQ